MLIVVFLMCRCPKCGYITLQGCSFPPWRPTSSFPLPGTRYKPANHHLPSTTYYSHVPALRLSLPLSGRTTTTVIKSSLHLSSCLLSKAAANDTRKQLSDIRRLNSLNIQMLSKPLHKQIFAGRQPRCSKKAVLRSKEHLSEQGLWDKAGTVLPDIDLQLPELQGDNIDQHFKNIASQLNKPYFDLAVELSQASLPPMPKEWSLNSGWTQYNENGHPMRVSHPSSQALVFDVEVCVKESPRPILAVAVSTLNWYSWVSDRLGSGEDFYVDAHTTADDLIPLEGSGEGEESNGPERLVVGHNVSYDRARIREQYSIEVWCAESVELSGGCFVCIYNKHLHSYPLTHTTICTLGSPHTSSCISHTHTYTQNSYTHLHKQQSSKTKFLDTMSLHTCVAGQTTFQKILWKANLKNSMKTLWEPWMDVSSPNSLVDSYWCHVSRGKKRISKEQRNVFVQGSVQDVRNSFQVGVDHFIINSCHLPLF